MARTLGAGARSRVSSSSRWSRRLHDGDGGGLQTQALTHKRSNAHAPQRRPVEASAIYERTRIHTNTRTHTDAHAHVRNHTHAANQKETGLSRDAIGGVRVSAAVLPRARGHGNIRTHAPPAAPPPAARGAHPGPQAHRLLLWPSVCDEDH